VALPARLPPTVPCGTAGCTATSAPARYAAGRHISVSPQGLDKGRIDEALLPLGLERDIATIVGGFSAALALARASDLIASVPDRHTANLRAGLHSFPLPVTTPEITVSLLWHPRQDADPAHRWLRGCVRDACRPTGGESGVQAPPPP
jgi:DNA-binding transcriptional LysR family regulator